MWRLSKKKKSAIRLCSDHEAYFLDLEISDVPWKKFYTSSMKSEFYTSKIIKKKREKEFHSERKEFKVKYKCTLKTTNQPRTPRSRE